MVHGDKISHVLVQRINVADMIANRGVERMKSEGGGRGASLKVASCIIRKKVEEQGFDRSSEVEPCLSRKL